MINIKYSFYQKDLFQHENILFFEPEPVLKEIAKERNNDALFLKCPAFLDYYKNCYLIKCPFDLTIQIDRKNKSLKTFEYDQNFYDKYINYRTD